MTTMTSLSRFNPMRDAMRLQDDVNRLFEWATRGAPSWGINGEPMTTAWSPSVDVYEDAEGVTLMAELPGMTASDIDLRIENGILTLKGERKLEREEHKDNYRRQERFFGAFMRSFTLPSTVDADRVRAESKHGVLTVFLPKREETKPKQIKVKVD